MFTLLYTILSKRTSKENSYFEKVGLQVCLRPTAYIMILRKWIHIRDFFEYDIYALLTYTSNRLLSIRSFFSSRDILMATWFGICKEYTDSKCPLSTHKSKDWTSRYAIIVVKNIPLSQWAFCLIKILREHNNGLHSLPARPEPAQT